MDLLEAAAHAFLRWRGEKFGWRCLVVRVEWAVKERDFSSGRVVRIYDTTLRDGTQGLGFDLSSLDKLRIAERLDGFGVGYIEGGWPGSNPKDIEFFREAARREWRHARIAAFGSTRRAGVAVAEDAQVALLLEADTPVVTFFGKSWDLHVREVLRTTEEENRAMIRETASHLKTAGREVVYDAEHFFDGYKADPEHALATLAAAEEGGADVVVLCDTNGGTLPHEVEEITAAVAGRLSIPVGIHTHDDCGLGVANALAAVRAGAGHVQGTINGYGERTGNCNLTSLIPVLQLKAGIPVVPDLARLSELSRFVDETANCDPNPRLPFVGECAFAHKGGMHVNAVSKVARSYEHIRPEEVGNRQSILVSELSGQSNILMRARDMGLELEPGSAEVRRILSRIKEMEKGGYSFEAAGGSLELLIRRETGIHRPMFEVLEYHCGFRHFEDQHEPVCEATVRISVGGVQEHTVAKGRGVVHALDAALRKALAERIPEVAAVHLRDYKVRIIDGSEATGAVTRVLVVSGADHETWSTTGVSGNVIEASWLALLEGIDYYLQRAVGGAV